jgi:phosphate transport system substrate-binding protein
MLMKISTTWLYAGLGALILAGCGSGGGSTATSGSGSSSPSADLSGNISIDGSSTVYPISQAVAEGFMDSNGGVNVTVSESGTGGGFKKFVNGELDITGASRPIEPEEVEAAKANGIEFIELPVAFDGLSVVVHPSNDWADSLTVEELKAIWSPDSKINNWKDVRAGFPDVPMKLFGAGTASGTFEYFTEAIVQKKKSSRSDYQASENDNTLVQGVAGDKGGLGYFGYAYYIENKDKLKIVKIDGGKGPIEPTEATINDGTYAPLSRPLFIYINRKSMDRPEVKAFAKFLLSAEGRPFIKETGYIELPETAYTMATQHVDDMKVGTRFQGTEVGLKIEDVLARDAK